MYILFIYSISLCLVTYWFSFTRMMALVVLSLMLFNEQITLMLTKV